MHAATSKVENLAQGSSCQLKFVHGLTLIGAQASQLALNPDAPASSLWSFCYYNLTTLQVQTPILLKLYLFSPFSKSLDVPIIWINQLPVSATRGQHQSQKCFATLIYWKVKKLLKTQQLLKLEKNKHRFEILENFWCTSD